MPFSSVRRRRQDLARRQAAILRAGSAQILIFAGRHFAVSRTALTLWFHPDGNNLFCATIGRPRSALKGLIFFKLLRARPVRAWHHVLAGLLPVAACANPPPTAGR